MTKSFLSYASPVFGRMFQSNFKESTDNIVNLNDRDYDHFLDMLLFLHPRVQKTVSAQRAIGIYELSHEYQIPTVMKAAEALILKQVGALCANSSCRYSSYSEDIQLRQNQSILDHAYEVLIFSKTYNNSKIYTRAVDRISVTPVTFIIKHRSYAELSDADRTNILLCRLKRVDSNCSNFLDEKLDFTLEVPK